MSGIPARVFCGYDDDERWFPFFTTAEAAQQFAKRQWRKDFPEYDAEQLTWRERTAHTEHVGYPDMWELDGTDYVVCGLPVYADAEAAWAAERQDEDEAAAK